MNAVASPVAEPAVSAAPAPPRGYPYPAWADEGDVFEVDPQLRPAYLEAARSGVGRERDFGSQAGTHAMVPTEDGRFETQELTYELWAHVARRDAARQQLRRKQEAVAWEARNGRSCAVCERRGYMNDYQVVPHERGFLPTFQDVAGAGLSMTACIECAPGLRLELAAREALPNGLTRQQATLLAVDTAQAVRQQGAA